MNVNFDKGDGLVPAVVQDDRTAQVLMLGYMNAESLAKTQESGKVTFFSRSRQELWVKGETSGNFLEFRSVEVDCDQDTLLVKAVPTGPVCHTGEDTCFGKNDPKGFLYALQEVIQNRKAADASSSYTAQLFAKGINRIAQKVGEEALELVIEAKDDNDERFLSEAADLMYHFLVLLSWRGYNLEDVEKVLASRT